MDNYNFAQPGWQCPICKRVYSPTTTMCYYCGNTGTITTDTVTVTQQEGCWKLLPVILTSYPPKYMWQCKRCGHGIITDNQSYPQSPCERCGASSKGDEKNDNFTSISNGYATYTTEDKRICSYCKHHNVSEPFPRVCRECINHDNWEQK